MSKNKHHTEDPGHPQKKTPAAPQNINPNLSPSDRKARSQISVKDYVEKICAGDRIYLSRAITLIESKLEAHQKLAQEIIEACMPYSGNSIRIGITGTPGVGKSTFIEKWGTYLIDQKRKLAVLAIDPSSQISKGSILGDKTRMASLSASPHAYIRPSPAGDTLGGVGHCTRSTIILCEAAGYDTIFIETVGVGQSETLVHSMVDFFLLLLLPGAGDELQGIKRGIVEMADLIAINKSDGDRLPLAKRSRQAYKNALHLFPPKESTWTPPVVLSSALSKLGLDEIWQLIQDYEKHTKANNFFFSNRHIQAKNWLKESINNSLKSKFLHHPEVSKTMGEIEKAVVSGEMTAFKGAELLINIFLDLK